jgi:hypothetical protein
MLIFLCFFSKKNQPQSVAACNQGLGQAAEVQARMDAGEDGGMDLRDVKGNDRTPTTSSDSNSPLSF